MLNNITESTRMPLIHMTPEQVASRLIADRLKVSDNAKELQRNVLDKKAQARRKIEDFHIEHDHEKIT